MGQPIHPEPGALVAGFGRPQRHIGLARQIFAAAIIAVIVDDQEMINAQDRGNIARNRAGGPSRCACRKTARPDRAGPWPSDWQRRAIRAAGTARAPESRLRRKRSRYDFNTPKTGTRLPTRPTHPHRATQVLPKRFPLCPPICPMRSCQPSLFPVSPLNCQNLDCCPQRSKQFAHNSRNHGAKVTSTRHERSSPSIPAVATRYSAATLRVCRSGSAISPS